MQDTPSLLLLNAFRPIEPAVPFILPARGVRTTSQTSAKQVEQKRGKLKEPCTNKRDNSFLSFVIPSLVAKVMDKTWETVQQKSKSPHSAMEEKKVKRGKTNSHSRAGTSDAFRQEKLDWG